MLRLLTKEGHGSNAENGIPVPPADLSTPPPSAPEKGGDFKPTKKPQPPVIIVPDPSKVMAHQEDEIPSAQTPGALTPAPSHHSRRGSNASSHRNHEAFRSSPSCSRSNSKTSKTSLVGDSLKAQLRHARQECPPGSHRFIVPRSSQESLITFQAIRDILSANDYLEPEEVSGVAEETCRSARQLFAILAAMKKGQEIYPLLNEGISDRDLPLRRRSDNQEPFALQRKTGESIETLEKWNESDLEKFDRIQWWMTAPVFKDKRHYDLDDNVILPFISFESNAETHEPKQGAYSEVYPVHVHPAHHQFWECSKSENGARLVAIKKLFSPDEKEFLKEVTILQALGSKAQKHPHLITLLATYRHKKKYHLMFPYADANLRKYWDDRPFPNFDAETVLWSLRQMAGIAEALSRIHSFTVTFPLSVDGKLRVQKDANLSVRKGEEKYGRHGDIKPENILWFKQTLEVEDKMGVLQIADFGLGRFHGRESRSNVDPYTVVASPTYEPPECKLRKPVSRAYDIWSLGCLYLEFITWLLKGSAEIEGFSNFRGRLASYDINDDNFFTIIKNPITGDSAVVREEVIDWVNLLHEHEKCSALIHDLLDLVMEYLLIGDSSERIRAMFLHRRLKGYLKKATEDEQYLLKSVPRQRNLGRRTHSNSAASELDPEIIITSAPDENAAGLVNLGPWCIARQPGTWPPQHRLASG